MGDLNLVVLSGRLARDPETKYLSSGQALTKFDLAVGKRFKQGDQWIDGTDFYNDITAWGRTAEVIRDYVKKGDQVIIRGRLGIDEWTNPEGQKRRKTQITVEEFSFGAKKGGGSGGGDYSARDDRDGGNRQSAPPRGQQQAPRDAYPSQEDDDDIPF